jgi:hypothetical protein
VDQPGVRERDVQQRGQAEVRERLVGHARGPAGDGFRRLEVTVRQRAQGRADRRERQSGAERRRCRSDQASDLGGLPGAVHRRVGREDLFDQRRPAARHPEHEDRPLRGVPDPAQRVEKRPVDGVLELRQEAQLAGLVVGQLGAFEAVAGGQLPEGVVVAFDVFVRFREREVELDAPGTREALAARAQRLHRGQPFRVQRFAAAHELQREAAVGGVEVDGPFEPTGGLRDVAGFEPGIPDVAGGVGKGRIERERGLEVGHGGGVVAGSRGRDAEAVASGRRGGVDLQRAFERGPRLDEALERQQGVPEMEGGAGRRGVGGEGAFEVAGGVVVPAEFGGDDAQRVEGVDVTGPQRYRLAQRARGVLEPAEREQRAAEIVVGLRDATVGTDRLRVERGRLRRAAGALLRERRCE